MPQVVSTGPKIIYSADGIEMPQWVKDPFDVLDYTIDWSDLLDGDDTILLVNYVIQVGSTLNVLSHSFTDTTTTCWLQSGTLQVTYDVLVQITTLQGRQEERTFQIACGQN